MSRNSSPPPQRGYGVVHKGGFLNSITGAPDTPDLVEAAQDESNASGQNVTGPNGGSQWVTNPDGTRTLQNTLGGPLGGANATLQGQVANNAAHPIADGTATRNKVIDAMFGQARSRLDPMFRQREDDLRTRLLNQGLDPGTEASGNAMGAFGRERNDAYGSALNSAIGMGNEAAQGEFGMNMAARQEPLSQMQQLAQLLNPGMGGALQGAHGPNTLAAAMGMGNMDMAKWQQQMQMLSDMIGGAGEAGGGIAKIIGML